MKKVTYEWVLGDVNITKTWPLLPRAQRRAKAYLEVLGVWKVTDRNVMKAKQEAAFWNRLNDLEVDGLWLIKRTEDTEVITCQEGS